MNMSMFFLNSVLSSSSSSFFFFLSFIEFSLKDSGLVLGRNEK